MKTVIEMAREAGLIGDGEPEGAIEACFREAIIAALPHFAALVREDEREACALVCESRYMGDNNREDMEARRCATAIRARGE